MKPSVGRIVHFYQAGIMPEHGPIAAIITKVWSDECVSIRTFVDGMPYGDEWHPSVMLLVTGSPRAIGGFYWCWPPRVD